MTNETLNQTIYVVIDGEISQITYRDYLNEYGRDLTTTPRGIGDRMHIREVEVDVTEQGYPIYEWQVWTWGCTGNKPAYTGTSFGSKEDADMYYYERSEWYVQEKNWDAPQWFYTEQAAEAEIIEGIATCYEIDNEVAAHIYRKEKIVNAIRAERETAYRAKVTAENEARKAYLATAVPAEAAAITIDEKFIADVKEAENLTKKDKANRHASALKGLIERHGKDKIESDFWQVFRILKAQAKI